MTDRSPGALKLLPRQAGPNVLTPTATRPGLPAQTTSFVGRERELTAVVALLDDPTVRLLTLTGPGGAGKTRLALEAVAHLGDAFTDGVVLVDLSALADPALILPSIARALGLRDIEGRQLSDQVRSYLQSKSLLLLLDNFEHLVIAAPLLS